MGKLAIYKYLSFMMLVLTVLVSVFVFMGLFGGNANPGTGTALALCVFALPIFIIADVILLLFWLIRRRWKWAVIPAVTLLCCIPYIGTIYQLGWFRSSGEDKPGINVATYNVAVFGREMNGYKAGNILSIMMNNEIDIFCIQEYQEESGDIRNSERYLKYVTAMAKGRPGLVIFSRNHPILESQIIDFGNTSNSAMWADIDINGQTVRVFNVHLQTTGVNSALHQAAKQESRGQLVERNALLRAIYGNYTRGMAIRAGQADAVAAEIEKSPYPVILCGDFNDVPYSYVYRTMKGDLTDGFKESGQGFMYTMGEGRKRVRIDYIFHSDEMEGYDYRTLKVTYSDHLPVLMRIGI